MSIAKPFTFTANTYAKASEVNADFDIVYSQVNTNISDIAQNATDIDTLENNKANINGSTSQRFAVADAISAGDAINKQTLMKSLGNSIDYIGGLIITKDSGSPEDTIIVSAGSAYDSTKSIVLSLTNSLSKQNTNQAANATYYVYIIGSSSGSQTDILISPNQVTPTLPTGYSLYRQIGYYTTNSDNEIDTISYYGESANSDKSANGIAMAISPDYSAGIDIADGFEDPFVAPTNGWLIATVFGAYSDEMYIKVNDNIIGRTKLPGNPYYDGYLDISAIVNKGDSITFKGKGDESQPTTTRKFFPLKGGN